MFYRVVLTKNGKYKKTLYKSKTKESAFSHYRAIKEENKVLFPKKHIKTPKGIIPVKYMICVTKNTEKGDVRRTLRDDYGKTYIEKPLGDWTILDSIEFNEEENFFIFGKGYNLYTIKDIVKKLVTGAHKKNMVKQIIVVHNKLVIYNEDYFDMIICKCIDDAQRLHQVLGYISKKQKIKSLLFMGTATLATVSQMYRLIHEKTGWKMTRIRRRTTRP